MATPKGNKNMFSKVPKLSLEKPTMEIRTSIVSDELQERFSMADKIEGLKYGADKGQDYVEYRETFLSNTVNNVIPEVDDDEEMFSSILDKRAHDEIIRKSDTRQTLRSVAVEEYSDE